MLQIPHDDAFVTLPSSSFITKRPAALSTCAISALVVKSQSPRVAKAIDPFSCQKIKKSKQR